MDILMIIEADIASTYLIEQVLKACSSHGITYRKQYLSSLKIKDFDTHTIPLFVRCANPSLEVWIELLRHAKRPWLYYIDDNFWQIEGSSPLANYYQHPLIRRSLGFAVINATRVLTNSTDLAKFLGGFTQRISILPTFFDFSFIADAHPEETHEIRIGFAGGLSRLDDLEIIRPVIQPVLDEYPDVVFEFAGVLPRGIEANDRIRFFPHTNDYSEFILFQAERNWAIGLSPLFYNQFNRCKTNNKYREYGACKIAGIYSDVTPYQSSIVSGVNGVLVANSTIDWLAAIKKLVVDPLERMEIGRRAYSDVLSQHCVKRVSLDWAACILDVSSDICDQGSQHQLPRNILVLNEGSENLSLKTSLLELSDIRKSLRARRLRNLFRRKQDMWAILSPSFEGVRQYILQENSRKSGMLLELSDSLHDRPYAEYMLPFKKGVLENYTVVLASEGVHDGLVGIEIVSSTQEILSHVVLSLSNINLHQPVIFPLARLKVEEGDYFVRLFVKTEWPIYLVEFAKYRLGMCRKSMIPFCQPIYSQA